MEVEFDRINLSAFAVVTEATMRNNQQNQSDQHEHAACRRKLLQDRPKKFVHHMQPASAVSKALWSFCGNVFRVKPITGARLRLKVRPGLADFQAFGYALPESLHAHGEGEGRR